MAWTVTEVFDGDTFRVSANWKWHNESGDVVRPVGYDTPEEGESGYDEATDKLAALILGQEVELKNPVDIDAGRLLCTVYYNGVDIATHFPEYAV